jgi:hypothetical protein
MYVGRKGKGLYESQVDLDCRESRQSVQQLQAARENVGRRLQFRLPIEQMSRLVC